MQILFPERQVVLVLAGGSVVQVDYSAFYRLVLEVKRCLFVFSALLSELDGSLVLQFLQSFLIVDRIDEKSDFSIFSEHLVLVLSASLNYRVDITFCKYFFVGVEI